MATPTTPIDGMWSSVPDSDDGVDLDAVFEEADAVSAEAYMAECQAAYVSDLAAAMCTHTHMGAAGEMRARQAVDVFASSGGFASLLRVLAATCAYTSTSHVSAVTSLADVNTYIATGNKPPTPPPVSVEAFAEEAGVDHHALACMIDMLHATQRPTVSYTFS